MFVVLLILALVLQGALGGTYLGCYRDQYAATDRDMSGSLFLEEAMTPDFCDQKCGEAGFKYFGLQYGIECWCGNSYGRHGKLGDSECTTRCAGKTDAICGGELKNSVYEVSSEIKARPKVSGRPLLALVMIVKNEAHTLPSTLITVKPYIDYYYILDTGSTDGTQDAIRKTLGESGEIFEEPFVNYGASRNRIMELAQKSKNPPIFMLMLSADETVYNGATLRKFCEDNRNAEGPMHEAYPVTMDVGWRFDSVRLSRTDKGWRYVGRVHEYLAAPDKKWRPSLRVPNTYIKFRVTDPERRADREWTILKILQQEKAEEPTNTRTSFYLARTWNVLRNHTEALKEFRRRVELGGWQEEVYESLYAIAWQLKALDRPWHEVQQAFMDAHEHSPERAEPLYAVASHWQTERKHALCFMFAQRAAQLDYPKRAVLWVQNDVYSYQAHTLVTLCAFPLGMYEIGARSLIAAQAVQPNDPQLRDMEYKYKDKLTMDQWARITQGNQAHLPAVQQQTSPGNNANNNANANSNQHNNQGQQQPQSQQQQQQGNALPVQNQQPPVRLTPLHPDEQAKLGKSRIAVYLKIAVLLLILVLLLWATVTLVRRKRKTGPEGDKIV